jgi:hypothetical protein
MSGHTRSSHERLSSVPIIDYAAHPGFADFAASARRNDPLVDVLIGDIDLAYSDIQSALTNSNNPDTERFKLEVDSKIDNLLAHTLADPGIAPEFVGQITSAFGAARAFLMEAIEAQIGTLRLRNSETIHLPAELVDRLVALQADGFCNLPTQAELARSVWTKTRMERTILRGRAARWPNRHCAMPLHPWSPGYMAVKRAVEKDGILDVASAYLGKPMEFYYAALDHAHPAQSWYKDCYSDKGIPTTRTAYMHFDADAGMLKAMLYLVDVGPEDGPFSYVRGSHNWHRSPFISALQNGFDAASRDVFETERDRLDYKLGYYRPRFKLPDQRRNLLALPPPLRGTTHFGDDILDGTETSDALMRREVALTGQAGTCILFDGSQGIHRGSLVTNGRRWAIQIGLRVRTEKPLPRRGRMGWLKDRIRRMPHISRIRHLRHVYRELYYLITD